MEKVAETVAKPEMPIIKIENIYIKILEYPQKSYFETNCLGEDVKNCLESGQNVIFEGSNLPKNYPKGFKK